MAIEAEELTAITRSIRNAGMETAGEFRQAATAGNANLSRIVKDISTTFKAQREDIADLHNVLEEMVSESQQTGNKIDSLNSLFRESLEIQNSMRTEISNVTKNTRILSGDIESLNRNIMNTSTSGLLGSITNLSTDFAKQLALMGVGAGVAAGGMTALGAMGGGGDVPGIKTSGSLSQNQQEAYKAARGEGLSDTAAKIAVANVSGENLKNPGGVYADPSSRNPHQKAHGIVAWDDERSARIKQVFGKYPQEMSVAEQTKAYIWEMKTHYKTAYNDLINENLSERQRLSSVVENFEKPKDSASAVANRMGYLRGFKPNESSSATPTTPTATQVSTPEVVPSNTSSRVESIGKEGGHGPISGAAHGHGEKMETSSVLPSGDIVALGKALQGMGVRVSEHPAFGGVDAKAHGRNSAHYDGSAIDINSTSGNSVEAQDPVWGAKFDQLAKQIQAAGYTVLWRTKGHNNHIHAQLGGKGIRGGQSIIGGQTTPSTASTPTTPGSSQPQMTAETPTMTSAPPAPTGSTAAEPVAQAPISPGVSAGPAGMNPMAMMGMMGGMMPGGIGGIAGMLLPLIASTIQSEMVSAPSAPALNTQMLNQAAVSSEATEQTVQEAQVSSHAPQVNAESNRMHNSNQAGYAYNMPGDIEWPDWASMLGGNHYEEMKNYKKNMSWG